MALTKQQVVDWLMRCGEVFSRERDFLTQLDTEIGDADHGLNMNRGFNKVVEKLPSVADKDIGFILKNTGMTLLSSVGGASGPLFGTFFIRAAQAANAAALERLKAPNEVRSGIWLMLRCQCASPAPSSTAGGDFSVRARSVDVTISAPPPSEMTQQSSRCSGSAIIGELTTSSTVTTSRSIACSFHCA